MRHINVCWLLIICPMWCTYCRRVGERIECALCLVGIGAASGVTPSREAHENGFVKLIYMPPYYYPHYRNCQLSRLRKNGTKVGIVNKLWLISYKPLVCDLLYCAALFYNCSWEFKDSINLTLNYIFGLDIIMHIGLNGDILTCTRLGLLNSGDRSMNGLG